MKPYYTLSCIILPAIMMAACSANGPRKNNAETPHLPVKQISENSDTTANNKETIATDKPVVSVASSVIDIPEQDKFPLIQTNDELQTTNVTQPPARLIYQFAFNKQDISQLDSDSLQQHAHYLLANPDSTVSINGHTDTQGDHQYNKYLSKQRAAQVAELLMQYGVPKSQINISGLGDSQPLNDINNFKENRRVELEYRKLRVATN